MCQMTPWPTCCKLDGEERIKFLIIFYQGTVAFCSDEVVHGNYFLAQLYVLNLSRRRRFFFQFSFSAQKSTFSLPLIII